MKKLKIKLNNIFITFEAAHTNVYVFVSLNLALSCAFPCSHFLSVSFRMATPSASMKIEKYNGSQCDIENKKVVTTFGRLTAMDKKHAKFTEQQIGMLKTLPPVVTAMLATKDAKSLVGALKDLLPIMADVSCKAIVLQAALEQRRVSKSFVEKATATAQISLRKELLEVQYAHIVSLFEKKAYTLDQLKTYCLMEFKTFQKNMRVCMIYKNLSAKLGLVDTLSDTDMLALKNEPESAD
jgi:hypothetical protein